MATTMQNPFADMMKSFSEFKPGMMNMPQMPSMPAMPSIDMTQIMNVGRRNAEACTAASQALTESCQMISRRQAELARAQVEKTLKTCKDMLVNGSPEINTTKQMELAKTMFESSFNNLREVYELMTKSNLEAFDKLNRRASESIEEMTATATSTTGSKRKSA
ncbi:MAG: phasin family protein [Rickettsiales bacterium]